LQEANSGATPQGSLQPLGCIDQWLKRLSV
jgi:hypothetical protein